MKAPFLIGRLLFGGYFLYSGINHLKNHEQMAPYAKSKGVPNPDATVMLTGIPLVIGGASILLGVKPKLGAAAILGFLAGVSPIMHDFWRNEDPNERQANTHEADKPECCVTEKRKEKAVKPARGNCRIKTMPGEAR